MSKKENCISFVIGQYKARQEFDKVMRLHLGVIMAWYIHMQYVHLCSCKYLRYVERSILESKSCCNI